MLAKIVTMNIPPQWLTSKDNTEAAVVCFVSLVVIVSIVAIIRIGVQNKWDQKTLVYKICLSWTLFLVSSFVLWMLVTAFAVMLKH